MTTHNLNFRYWGSFIYEIIIRLSTLVSRGYNLQNKLGLVFWYDLHSNHLQWQTFTFIQKRGSIPTQINSQILKPVYMILWEILAIWCKGATTTHLPRGFTPTNTCLTSNYDNRCLGYVAFECHANFHINWESFVHRDQQKTCLGLVAPKAWRWQMSSKCLRTGSIVN